MMYLKDKKNTVIVRFNDYDFGALKQLSTERGISVSKCVRSIIEGYICSYFCSDDDVSYSYDYIGGIEND